MSVLRGLAIGADVSIGMTHFPGLDFQRITTANGREWTTAR
jgi:hypothetical protein